MLWIFQIFLLGIIAISGIPVSAWSREAPTEPILRIEMGVHASDITGLATDANGQIIATSSYDKTVRLWTPNDRYASPQVLRVPLDLGREGSLYSVALAPDAGRVVTAGWTGEWDDKWSLYIFELPSGRLEKRIANLPHRIVSLAFSSDGRFLAAGLKAQKGLLVFNTEDWSVVARDRDQEDDIPSLHFDHAGRLILVSLDGTISLYDRRFRRILKTKVPSGAQPAIARFSPDGRTIAIGHTDISRIDLLDVDKLDLLKSLDSREINYGLTALAWSHNGEFLYAAGKYERGGRNLIRRWSEGGFGESRDIPAARGNITHLLMLNKDSIAFTTTRGGLGILNKNNRVTWKRRSVAADFRDSGDSLRVSADGQTVEFSYQRFGDISAWFSLKDKLISVDETMDVQLHSAVTEAPGLRIRQWRDSERPVLNGKPLPLQRHESSISLAIAADQETFVMGTNWRVIGFNKLGIVQWSISAPSEAYAVNITKNGKLVVAAFGDGSIRWFLHSNGKELLAFFPHEDKLRWVTWTPSGYYMASAGGDTLIGWHVNRDKQNAADFFAISRFRNLFYRPDIIENILDTLDEIKAIRKGDLDAGRVTEELDSAELLPPVITILSPKMGSPISSPHISIAYEILAKSEDPVKTIHVRANGRPIAEFDGGWTTIGSSVRREIDVYVPRVDSIVEIIAETVRGVLSEPGSVRLKWKGDVEDIQPSLYILAVGISDYKSPGLKLDLPAKDANDFSSLLGRLASNSYRNIQMRVLTDHEANYGAMREALDWFSRVPTWRDVAVLFIAGHGVDDPAGRYFYVPFEVAPERVFTDGLSYLEIRRSLARVAGRSIIFIDTCHSGAIWGKKAHAAMDVGRIINDLSSPEIGVIVFASSTGNQLSYENLKWGNGAFTKAVLEGFKGKADLFGNGYVTISGLDAYISDRVPKITEGLQTPATGKPVEADFKLVILE